MADENFYHAQCQYYCREQFYHAMLMTAAEAMKKFGGSAVWRFWQAMGTALEGRLPEALRQLEAVSGDGPLQLAAVLAQLYCHQLCPDVDREAVQTLDGRRRELRKRADATTLYHAGVFLTLSGHPAKAREYLDRSLKQAGDAVSPWVMRGWVEMLSGENVTRAMEYLEQAAKRNARDVSLLLCRAKYFQLHNDFGSAQAELNQLVAMHPTFIPPLVEKMKLSMAMHDWEQSQETAGRILSLSPQNIEALRFRLIGLITRDRDFSEARRCLEEFVRTLSRYEPHNVPLLLECARLFSRTCGRNGEVLDYALALCEKAVQLVPSRADARVELGYQQLLRENGVEALRCYKAATKLDESSLEALTGLITCHLLDNQLNVAQQSLEFIKETQKTLGHTSDIVYLSAVLARKQGKSHDEILHLLSDAIETHFRSFRSVSLSVAYLIALNPDLLLLLVRECLQLAPSQPGTMGSAPPRPLKLALAVLEPVSKACPGLLEALYLMAKTKYLMGDVKSAAAILKHCIDDVDQTYSDAHLLNAQIQLYQGFYKQAAQSLELGLSYNFTIKEHPLYHLIRSRVQKQEGAVEEAVSSLHSALQLAGLTSRLVRSTERAGSGVQLTATDQVSIYLELADAYRLAGQQEPARQVVEEAGRLFEGTGEQVRVLVVSADLLLARRDVTGALAALRDVTPDQPYYLQSRQKMGEIYLHKLRDRRMYAACYREIVENIPTPESYMMLGDAFVEILEPDKAIEVYESALKRNPRNHDLAVKMGRALVKTHHYGKAINYYKEAIKVGEDNDLRYDMAYLLTRMRQYDKAEKTIQQALERVDASGLTDMAMQARLLQLLARVHELTAAPEKSVAALQQAGEVQVRVLKRAQLEQPDSVPEQRQRAADICCTMAERQAKNPAGVEAAVRCYREALQHNPEDERALLALARLFLQSGHMDECQQTCMTMLRQDRHNDIAAVMMADMSFRRHDYDTALHHFRQLLQRRPDYFAALARLVEVLRRTGSLDQVPQYLEKAETVAQRGALQPGLGFCRGLYLWYTGNSNTALRAFNLARDDAEWGQRAVHNMISICLNPQNMTVGGEAFESVDELADPAAKSSQEAALSTAANLLPEIKPRPGEQSLSYQLLSNFLLLAANSKSNTEQALQNFSALAASDAHRDHPGAVCGVATAYTLLKQTTRARNQLKLVSDSQWTFENGEYLERCWLLLADIHIQSSKYDWAQEVLQRTLRFNRSCGKAHEYLGFIREKENNFREAARCYEAAWRLSRHSDPVIGYKLAFNYLKAKRFVDAIQVCHQVLNKHPDYPKIRKEILEKARAQLKL